MIRIIGNSPERIPIKDLNDVIYYRQIKEYTDDEYENSLDLKKVERQGKISKLEEKRASRGSAEIPGHESSNQTSISVKDLKTVLQEFFPNKNNGSSDLTQAIKEIGPLIADMIRQEISRLVIQGQSATAVNESPFIGPEYIPTIDASDMISNIEAEERKASVDDIDNNLAVLRKLRSKSK